MAKKSCKTVKLQIPAGKQLQLPPVGPALGQAQVNIMGFCKSQCSLQRPSRFNHSVVISVYEDRSFDFIWQTPPAAEYY